MYLGIDFKNASGYQGDKVGLERWTAWVNSRSLEGWLSDLAGGMLGSSLCKHPYTVHEEGTGMVHPPYVGNLRTV